MARPPRRNRKASRRGRGRVCVRAACSRRRGTARRGSTVCMTLKVAGISRCARKSISSVNRPMARRIWRSWRHAPRPVPQVQDRARGLWPSSAGCISWACCAARRRRGRTAAPDAPVRVHDAPALTQGEPAPSATEAESSAAPGQTTLRRAAGPHREQVEARDEKKAAASEPGPTIGPIATRAGVGTRGGGDKPSDAKTDRLTLIAGNLKNLRRAASRCSTSTTMTTMTTKTSASAGRRRRRRGGRRGGGMGGGGMGGMGGGGTGGGGGQRNRIMAMLAARQGGGMGGGGMGGGVMGGIGGGRRPAAGASFETPPRTACGEPEPLQPDMAVLGTSISSSTR